MVYKSSTVEHLWDLELDVFDSGLHSLFIVPCLKILGEYVSACKYYLNS